MAKAKTDAPVEGRVFMGRAVRKETFSIGIGGVIERSPEDPITPPESEVTFKATARVGAVKHKFLEHGGVEEMTILTLEPDSFRILNVEEKLPDPELPLEEQPPKLTIAEAAAQEGAE